jgi:hypothetical protein
MAHHRFVVIAAALLDRALAQTLDHDVRVGDELEHGIERRTVAGEELVELTHLVGRARIAVEQEAVLGVLLLEAMPDEIVREGVRHIVAGIHVDLRLLAERGLVAHVAAEDVARRDRRDSVAFRQPGSLGALAGAWGSDQEEAGQRRRPS